MPQAPVAAVPRPPLAFRVGVTGSRHLFPDALDRLRPAVKDLLALVASKLNELAKDPLAQAVYAPGAPLLRLVSPLAEGADRLVAEEGLKAGFALYAPLPFAQAEYERDFPDSVDAFRALLARAETLELDGDRANAESYREVGRYVVRNCDLLIGVWDGEEAHGAGGTAEIVQFAVSARLPVWWIDARGTNPPRLIDAAAHLRDPSSAPAGEAARAALKQYIEKSILPPALPHPEHSGVFGHIAHRLGGWLDLDAAPLSAYLAEKPLAPHLLWTAFDLVMEKFGPRPKLAAASVLPPATPAEHWWRSFYSFADAFSDGYGDRYRSSYVLIAGLAFLALAMAALGTALPQGFELFIGGVEIFALGAIAVLVIMNHLHRWHEKWISYRLFAELCRKQYVLASIGRSLPGAEVTRVSLDAMEIHEGGETHLPREAWVAWYFAAALRAAPFVVGSLAAAKGHALAMARSLAAEQIAYHRVRCARNKAASHAIGRIGELLFFLTVLAGAAKLFSLFALGEQRTLIAISASLGALLSAASGAFVGVRAYSEFSLLVRQSTHMLRLMKEAEAEFSAIDLDAPLASRDLGRRMYALVVLMMNDVRGWAQLFGIKTLEAGG